MQKAFLYNGEEWDSRRSKDSKVNKEGKRLLEFIKKREWFVINGSIEGDEEGEWTYTEARGESIIDYVLGDEEVVEEVTKLEIGEKIDSDHYPVIVWIKGKEVKERRGKARSGGWNRGIWDEMGRERFRQGLRDMEWGGEDIQKTVNEVEKKIRDILKKSVEEKRGEKVGRKGWWDTECAIRKEVRRRLREWKKGKIGGEIYREEKKEYKELRYKKNAE
ncbi:uncharacterized protein LOC118647446 [Monomorium pharaonis]|uniref:uncharacterized protein LOC118647446 n=1 Tax=Monomorium pharaonis TaxID=307658 RepID=UPI0017472440|nr:uncharacterized protein LOC118647446 [Monomorium pharaonis]